MFMRHNERTRDVARQLTSACLKVAVKVSKTLTNAIPEHHDRPKRRPILIVLRNLRVVLLGSVDQAVSIIHEREKDKSTDMAMFRIINVRVNASL